MDVILFNIENGDRLRLYESYFEMIGFKIVGLLSDKQNFDYGKYKKIVPEDLKNTKFDLLMAHNNSIAKVKSILDSQGLPQSKSRILYYDFNNIQKINGDDNINKLFYDIYDIKNGKLQHTLKFKKLLGKYIDVKSSISKEKQKEIAHEVYESYKKQLAALKDIPQVYQAGRNWGNYMRTTRPDFYNAVKEDNENYISELLPNFFRNCMSTGMFGGKEAFDGFLAAKDFYNIYFECYKVWMAKTCQKEPDITSLGMSPEGSAYGINIEGNLVNLNSFFFHARATLCKNLLGDDKKSIVAEIGGGVGLLGHYLMKLAKNITYIDFDLPDNLISASYYLKASFPDKKVLLFDERIPLTRDLISSYDIILMPNYMIQNLEDNSIDMFINTISFGEMNYDAICEYYSQIERCGRKYFYQENLHAPQGDYESYPISVFPELKKYKLLYSTCSSWPWIYDSLNKNHMYEEQLYEKK